MLATPPPALASPDPAVGVTDPTTLFATSFEPTEAQPTWINTVETDAAGTKKASGVDDTFSRGIPGSIADKVVQIQASGENASAGEVKENLNDGDFQSKWLVFTSTAWVQYKLSEPVAVVHYALTSANDEPGRDPQDWTLRGSQDGQAWVDLDRQTGQMFTERFQTRSTTSPTRRRTCSTGWTSPATTAPTSSSSPSCNCPMGTPRRCHRAT